MGGHGSNLPVMSKYWWHPVCQAYLQATTHLHAAAQEKLARPSFWNEPKHLQERTKRSEQSHNFKTLLNHSLTLLLDLIELDESFFLW